VALHLAQAERRRFFSGGFRTVIGHRNLQAERLIGQRTPVPTIPQYPLGFFARYCW
jgi:hypothetical protein